MLGKSEAQPIWLTISEATAVMRLSRNTLYQLVAEGVVPHRRLGRSIHIHRDVAEHWTPTDVEPVQGRPVAGYEGNRR